MKQKDLTVQREFQEFAGGSKAKAIVDFVNNSGMRHGINGNTWAFRYWTPGSRNAAHELLRLTAIPVMLVR